MARPSKLTNDVRERICRAIRAGNYPAVAARAAGIAESTFYRWMERGRTETKGSYRAFYEAVNDAEAESEVHAVAILRQQIKGGDWRAAVALLERRHSQRWHRRERHEHTIQDERPVVDLSRLSERELKALEKISDRLTERD
jgi:transposase